MRTQRKLLATLLSLVVLISLVPPSAFAADGVTTEEELQKAVASGGTITLGGDIALTQTLEIPAETTVVLDLNGYTLTQTGIKDRPVYDDYGDETGETYQGPINGIDNYGTLTISGGSITGTWHCIWNAETGVLTVNGGSYSTKKNAIYNDGSAKITDGTFTAEEGNGLYNGETGTVEISGGSYSAENEAIYNDGTAKITNGTFTSEEWNGLYNGKTGTAEISGGSFSGGDTSIWNDAEESAAVIKSGTHTNGYFGNCTFEGGTFSDCTVFGVIRGGTFSGGTVSSGTIHGGTFQDITSFSATVADDAANVQIALKNATLSGTITGGFFTGTIEKVPSLKLKGGTYSSELKTAIEALNYQFETGYGFVENLDGTYSVQNVGKSKFRIETADSEKGILTSIRYKNGSSTGSSMSDGNNTAAMSDISVTTGGTVTFSAAAQANENYIFTGWYTNQQGSGSPAFTEAELTDVTYTVNADTVLYAVFMGSEAYNEMVSKANTWVNGYNSQSEFTVASTDDMWCFAYAVNNLGKDFAGKTVKLTADLDFDGAEYIPVGTNTAPFKGTFDGGNHTISNIDCSATYCGVFGFMSGDAVVKNLTVQNSTFSDGYFCGAIAGEGAGTIENCTVSNCTVSGQFVGDHFVGGAVGHTDKPLVMTNVKVENTTVNTRWKSGGLVGYNGASLTTEGCEVNNVQNSGGGLYGQAVGHANADVTLKDTKVSSEGEEKSPLIATAYSAKKTITLSGEKTEVDVSTIIPVTAPADIVIQEGRYQTTEPMEVSGGTGLTLGKGADISTSGDPIAVLDEGAKVTKSDGTTATAAKGSSVDQYGNLILPAGSTVKQAEDGEATELQKDTVITPNGNIVQGTDTTAPTVGENGVVTVPSGGSVTGPDGEVIVMPHGGTVTPNKETDTITQNKAPSDEETIPGGGNVSGGSHHSSSSSVTTYPVTVDSAKHGTVTASAKNASRGTTVTVTVKPDDGYELDGLTVTDKDGKTVKVTEGKNDKFTFTMPASKVTIEAGFTKTQETPDQRFTDVPEGYWAEDEINWAADNGYMNGNTATTFNPEGSVTRQQLWMILARLSGYRPADFAEAKAWAMDNQISDGSNPENAVTRQQLVTILYRYAVRMGYKTTGTADLTRFPDHASVAAYAADAMSWSVAGGIVGGTSAGTLNPAGTATRAQFAVILYRFCEKTVG